MTAQHRTPRYERIAQHGRQLLAIFPNATEKDPVKLCKKLRKLEATAAHIGLRLCNGPEFEREDTADLLCEGVLAQVDKLLGNVGSDRVPIFVNRDPRGYALKIRDDWMNQQREYDTKRHLIHQDWGGYGIIAPEIE